MLYKNNIRCVFLLIAAVGMSFGCLSQTVTTSEQGSGVLVVSVNKACLLYVDGAVQGKMIAGDVKSVTVIAGEHIIVVKSIDGTKILLKKTEKVLDKQSKIVDLIIPAVTSTTKTTATKTAPKTTTTKTTTSKTTATSKTTSQTTIQKTGETQKPAITSAITATDYDGNVYNTVTIGTQIWMKENLRTTHYSNGNEIANVSDGTAWSALTTGAYCSYDNKEVLVNAYGRLYNWFAVSDNRKICPAGYHIPTDAEWKILEMNGGLLQKEANSTGWRGTSDNKLKEAGISNWKKPNSGATNTTGFTALPGGYRGGSGAFDNFGSGGCWWTATNSDYTNAAFRMLTYYGPSIYRDYASKKEGYSVRCLKDQ